MLNFSSTGTTSQGVVAPLTVPPTLKRAGPSTVFSLCFSPTVRWNWNSTLAAPSTRFAKIRTSRTTLCVRASPTLSVVPSLPDQPGATEANSRARSPSTARISWSAPIGETPTCSLRPTAARGTWFRGSPRRTAWPLITLAARLPSLATSSWSVPNSMTIWAPSPVARTSFGRPTRVKAGSKSRSSSRRTARRALSSVTRSGFPGTTSSLALRERRRLTAFDSLLVAGRRRIYSSHRMLVFNSAAQYSCRVPI
mmetsp:Transcript_14085/g.45989  ORF Transcript_14085/g.45989 Transcript_14085/m.45989 type:complete len:253 (-) Transcript_14085:1190-1948(-)